MNFDENPERRVRSIQPQNGGYCELFKEKNCGGEHVQIWKDDTTTDLECPGMSDAGKPDWFASMKCRKFSLETGDEGGSGGSDEEPWQGSAGGDNYPGRVPPRLV